MELNRPEVKAKVVKFLNYLEKRSFYGKLEMTYQAGKICDIRKTENIKPGDL